MTPREVQFSIRAASERRLDRYDELLTAAWRGALWGRVEGRKFPKRLSDILVPRRSGRRHPLTLEQDVARWEAFFRSATPKGKAN